MARKKQEIALQVEIETQEEWEEMLAKEGITIVDVYAEWAGPCKAMVSNFRKIKNELGDDLLRFAVAKADTVDALEKYRGRCQPCFLFYAGGVLVYCQRGALVPEISRAILEHLSYEHKVLDGSAERKEIADPVFADGGDLDRLEDEDEDEEGSKKGVTVAIIKPNVVAAGKVDEIISKMEEHGIEILEKTERTLTKEEAQEFYAHKNGEEFFDQLCDFMSSGPSVILVLTKGSTGESIIDEWRDLLGPANVEEAKENAPDSLRAQFGDESFVNAVHGSDSSELAMQELAFFFPDYVVPSIPHSPAQQTRVQRTLALIRPDALREKKDDILAKIAESGFTVAMQKEIQLTKEQAGEFYKEHTEQPYFEELVEKMTNGPVLALALAREEAVTGWRDLLGPKEVAEAKEAHPESLRAQFSVEGEEVINPLHGSDTEANAQKELEFFFPMQQTVAMIKPDAFQTKDEIMAKIKEAGFHIAARKETSVTEEVAQQFYSDLADKEYYGDLVNHMTSGPTLFMVLSREDAVDGWRGLIGPTDPEVAKEQAPDTLRAQFGTDIKANAVHGSSNVEHAKKNMEALFGEMEFKTDGTVKGAEEEAAAQSEEAAAEGEKAAETTEAPAEAAATEEAPKAEDGTEQATEETKPEGEAPEAAAPAAEEAAPAAEATPAAEEAAPAAEATEAAEEAKPATPAAEEAKPATPAAEEQAPAAEGEQKAEEAAPAAGTPKPDAPAE